MDEPPELIIMRAPNQDTRREARYIQNIMTGETSAIIFSAFVKSALTSPEILANFSFS